MDENLTQDQLNTIRLTAQIISTFSCVGSFLVFSTYWFFKDNRFFIHELVQYYSLSNLFYAIASFLPYSNNIELPQNKNFYCALQSFTITMFQNLSLIWSSIIGYSTFISIINKNHFEKYKNKYRIIFILVSVIITAGAASM